MQISTRAKYDAATTRAKTISDAPEGTPQAQELASRVSAIRAWDEAHEAEHAHGPEEVAGLIRPDDLSISGLPGNLGKLEKD
jgi:hypothetical protein